MSISQQIASIVLLATLSHFPTESTWARDYPSFFELESKRLRLILQHVEPQDQNLLKSLLVSSKEVERLLTSHPPEHAAVQSAMRMHSDEHIRVLLVAGKMLTRATVSIWSDLSHAFLELEKQIALRQDYRIHQLSTRMKKMANVLEAYLGQSCQKDRLCPLLEELSERLRFYLADKRPMPLVEMRSNLLHLLQNISAQLMAIGTIEQNSSVIEDLELQLIFLVDVLKFSLE